jgi:hypothetical protein
MRKVISKLIGPLLAISLLTGIIVAHSSQVQSGRAKRAADPRQTSVGPTGLSDATIVYRASDGTMRARVVVPSVAA